MTLEKARIASIENEVAKLDFANAKEVIADNDSNKTNLRHLRLTFEALDRLFALKSRNDIFKIDIEKILLVDEDKNALLENPTFVNDERLLNLIS